MPGQSLCYGRGLCENFLNIPYSLREKRENNKRAKNGRCGRRRLFPGGRPPEPLLVNFVYFVFCHFFLSRNLGSREEEARTGRYTRQTTKRKA